MNEVVYFDDKSLSYFGFFVEFGCIFFVDFLVFFGCFFYDMSYIMR